MSSGGRRYAPWELIPDGEERDVFLEAISYPSDPARREGYRAWLAMRGDPRAELFALESELARSGGDATTLAAKRARVRGILSDERTRAWWSIFARVAPIRNCGEKQQAPPRVRFMFLCSRSWDDLEPTAHPSVRRCSTCEHDVHHCDTPEDAAEHARRGDCITVPARIAAIAGSSSGYTGRPDPLDIWGRAIFGAEWGEEG